MSKLRVLAALFAVAMVVSGCSEDEDDIIYDFVNPSVCFYVYDSESGINLCDPDVENSVFGWPVKVTTDDGDTYPLTFDGRPSYDSGDMKSEVSTRATLCRSRALRLESNLKGWHLSFGEFSPTVGYRNKRFEVDWGDGTKTEVCFNLYIKWKKNKPNINSDIWMDGRLIGCGSYENWHIEIRK